MQQRTLPHHGDFPAPLASSSIALAGKGFRPFFLLAAAFACAIVPIWILIVAGLLAPSAYLDPSSWHAHEMVFGYATAVIAGFLLTAVGNWTKCETVVGGPLLALAALWVAGRVAMASAVALPRGAAALIDLAFLPALFVALARPLVAAKNRRNFVMLAVIAALFGANVVVHLDALGVAKLGSARQASLFAVDVVVFVIVVIAGRVLPMFTRNATGVATIRSLPALDAATAIAMIALVVVDAALPESRLAAAIAGGAGVLALARAAHWGTRHAFREPLLGILHLGYAWIPFGLVLRAMPLFGAFVWSSIATHALTAGAIGTLTLGMMARVALGHTGRPLKASRAVTFAFVLVTAAAVARVVVPLLSLRTHFVALIVAAMMWTLAFALFLVAYAPILLRPRVDGKPG